MFRMVLCRRCDNLECEQYGKDVGAHEVSCTECRGALSPERGWNLRRLIAAGGLLALLLAGLTPLAVRWSAHRSAQRQAAVFAEAEEAFRASLKGAESTEVDAIADATVQRFGLDPKQRGDLLLAARTTIDALPRPLTPQVALEIEALLRDLWRDSELSAADRAQLASLTERHHLRTAEVDELARELGERLKIAQQCLRRGKALAEERNFAEAERELRRAVEVDPGSAFVWANLGAVLAVGGRPEEAVSCYRKALELEPGNWLALYNWALVLARQGRVGDALEKLESALGTLQLGSERRALVDAMLSEAAFTSVRSDPRFPEILAAGAMPGTAQAEGG